MKGKGCEVAVTRQFLTLHLLNDHECGICPLGTAANIGHQGLYFEGNAYVKAKDSFATALDTAKETLTLACGCVWLFGDTKYCWQGPQGFCFRAYDGKQNEVTTCPWPWGNTRCRQFIPNQERMRGHMLQVHCAGVCPLGGEAANHDPEHKPSFGDMPIFVVVNGVAYSRLVHPHDVLDRAIRELLCGCEIDYKKELASVQRE
jgi:hypothetical protein